MGWEEKLFFSKSLFQSLKNSLVFLVKNEFKKKTKKTFSKFFSQNKFDLVKKVFWSFFLNFFDTEKKLKH